MEIAAQSPRITPFLWFDTNAAEAVAFYLSVFPNSRIVKEFRVPDDQVLPKGSVLTIDFELSGTLFTALNGGPAYKFNEAVSFFIRCKSQQEIDNYWQHLTDGGSEIACGWLRDRFGLCWQVVPENIVELIRPPKAMTAMMQMKKLDIATLEKAGRE